MLMKLIATLAYLLLTLAQDGPKTTQPAMKDEKRHLGFLEIAKKGGVDFLLMGDSITEGIGLGRVTPVIADMKVDKAYLIPDEEAVPLIFDLLEHEGLCMGGSTGINVAGAIRLAKEMGPGHTIVTILADFGTRYQSKLFNPDFLREKGLPVPEWLERRNSVKVPYERT
jgi:cysteine synthase A